MKRLELRWWQLVKYLAYVSGAALGAESPTVVASFAVGGGMAAVPAAVQAADNLVNTARALGAGTANPAAVAAKNFRPPVKTIQVSPRGPFTVLPVINWLFWLVLAVIVWLLLLLLGLGARRIVNRTKMYQNSRLSTTIS